MEFCIIRPAPHLGGSMYGSNSALNDLLDSVNGELASLDGFRPPFGGEEENWPVITDEKIARQISRLPTQEFDHGIIETLESMLEFFPPGTETAKQINSLILKIRANNPHWKTGLI